MLKTHPQYIRFLARGVGTHGSKPRRVKQGIHFVRPPKPEEKSEVRATSDALTKVFDFDNKQIRVEIQNGEPWFVLKDVCNVLGIENAREVVNRLEKDDVDSIDVIDSLGRTQNAYAVNETALYETIFRSNKPNAKKFTRWVSQEVLPSIRKTGSYSAQPELKPPANYLEACKAHVAALEIVAQQEKQLEEKQAQLALAQPKVEFFDAVADSKDAIDIGSAAKVLDAGLGRNNLFEFLRNQGILMDTNQPYQKYVDRGYFRVIEQKYIVPNGDTRISLKTLVYQKGLQFIERLLVDGYQPPADAEDSYFQQ